MSNFVPIRAIIFDMDGVLLDSEPFILKAAQTMMLQRYGVQVPHEAFTPFIGRGEDAYLGGAAQSRGLTLQFPEDKIKTYQLYLEAIRGQLKALTGVHSFIAKMKSNGIKLGIYSSADRMKVEGNLSEIGLDTNSISCIVTGSEVSHKKPHPEGYAKATELLGFLPEQTLVIEDAISGVNAGRAAGCPCLGITSSTESKKLLEAGALWTAPHLAEVPVALLQRLGV